MISKESLLIIHRLSIARYGGLEGIKDEGLLESAIARPYQTFGDEACAFFFRSVGPCVRVDNFLKVVNPMEASFATASV